jgi:hypothetical protein
MVSGMSRAKVVRLSSNELAQTALTERRIHLLLRSEFPSFRKLILKFRVHILLAISAEIELDVILGDSLGTFVLTQSRRTRTAIDRTPDDAAGIADSILGHTHLLVHGIVPWSYQLQRVDVAFNGNHFVTVAADSTKDDSHLFRDGVVHAVFRQSHDDPTTVATNLTGDHPHSYLLYGGSSGTDTFCLAHLYALLGLRNTQASKAHP